MNNKPHLIVDCDGVLLDPVLGFVKWTLLNFPEFDIVGALKSKFGFVEGCIKNFWASDSFATIPMIKASKYPIDYLKHHYKIDVITSCGDDKKIREARIKNLENHFGKNTFNEIYTLPFSSSKKGVYSLYDSETTKVIDDELPNIVDANECDLKGFWMSYHSIFKNLAYNTYDRNLEKKYKTVNWKALLNKFMSEHSK